VVCFVVGALVIAAVRHASRRSRGGATFERFVVAACATVAGAVVIRRSLLTALSLGDLRAAIIAVALAVAIVGAVWAAAARAPRAAGQLNPWPRSALLLVALIILVSVLPPMLLLADWGGSLQKILTLLAWSVSVAFVANVRRCGRGRPAVVATLCAVSLTTASAAAIPPRDVPSTHGEPRRLDLSVVIDSYATFDPSLGILMDVFRPALADRKFFAALGDRDDVINNTSLGSVPLRLADDPIPAVRNPPNIFVIVVDSLRPDYLSPYNAAATFTPAIADFASSSVVLRQAITPYAGTGLSEPAIWAGGLIQRAMYVHPFSAVNNLQRLLTAGGYRQYVSVDQILSLVLEGASPVTHLEPLLRQPDRLDQTARFDLCDTIPALIERLERDRSGAPVFVYTQPQNVHIRVLAPDSYIPKNDWVRMNGSSFFGPAVAAVSRVDRCFGRLIDFLKSSGMYDDSIVVLTSDHGDGYGEGGRWGHAFYLAPETVRIPLIVHVPAALMIGRAFNVRDTSQLTDLTPTLYDLLGIAPAKDSPLTGRSLFPRGGDAVTTGGAAPILVQSSYSPVFGLFDPSGRWMYVADIPHAREQLYELTVDPANAVSVPSARRPQLRKWLFDRMDQLDRFYSRPNRE